MKLKYRHKRIKNHEEAEKYILDGYYVDIMYVVCCFYWNSTRILFSVAVGKILVYV